LAISADSLHYRMDVLINMCVMVSLFLVGQFGWLYADPVFAIAIAGYIFWGSWEIARDALQILMDRELPDEDRKRILEIAHAHPDVLDAHDLKTRTSGLNVFIQLHLEMDPDLKLRDAHEISEAVMHSIEEAYPAAEVLIHEDPAGVEEKRSGLD